ncbi:MAG: hypothetical protein R3253_00015 [Longimicrobiales bacterium]|nr:hypothetical protein [Longimicrobiales bacterium]
MKTRFTLAMGRTSILGPLGIHAGLLNVYEDGSEVAEHCNFAP